MASSGKYPMCTICGIRLYDSSSTGYKHENQGQSWQRDAWRVSAVALMGPHREWDEEGPESMSIPAESVIRHDAVAIPHESNIMLLPDGPTVTPQFSNYPGEHPSHNERDVNWYLGVHLACLNVASQCMERSKVAEIRSIGDLWMVLDHRCNKTALDENYSTPFLPNVPENKRGQPIQLGLSGYYLPLNTLYNEQDELDDAVETWWDDDPLQIPNLTELLMSNLKTFDRAELCNTPMTFNELPQEMKDKITNELLLPPLPLGCTYKVPQAFWKQAFLQIPFLWDLDLEKVHKKSTEAESAGFEWDWERLTRKLMAPVSRVEDNPNHPKTWNYSQLGLDVPRGLKNRRRIWQILEEMYPNDVGMEYIDDE